MIISPRRQFIKTYYETPIALTNTFSLAHKLKLWKSNFDETETKM